MEIFVKWLCERHLLTASTLYAPHIGRWPLALLQSAGCCICPYLAVIAKVCYLQLTSKSCHEVMHQCAFSYATSTKCLLSMHRVYLKATALALLSQILVMQDLLNSNDAATIQITGSTTCMGPAAGDARCTNLTHLVLDYAAFQKLAHPGYGLMNLQLRSVAQSSDITSETVLCHNEGMMQAAQHTPPLAAVYLSDK